MLIAVGALLLGEFLGDDRVARRGFGGTGRIRRDCDSAVHVAIALNWSALTTQS